MRHLNLWLARKLLFSKKQVGFISWSSVVSILGVAIGCFALLISVAVLNGFETEIRRKVVGFESNLRITAKDLDEKTRGKLETILRGTDGVTAFSFYLERNGIAVGGGGRSLVRVKAVADFRLQDVYRIESSPVYQGGGDLPIAYLGRRVADRLGLQVGDTLRLFSPVNSQIFMGLPSTVRVLVGAIFQTNLLDFDDTYCFVPLRVGQQLFNRRGMFHGVDIRLADNMSTGAAVASLKSAVPDHMRITTWEELHQTLFSAMRMEKLGSIVVLSMIILVASFNIASALMMLVMEKVRAIGILRTVGASMNRIQRIFNVQGSIIGGIGLSLGFISALCLIFLQRRWGFVTLPENIYFLKSVPVALSWFDVFVILVVGAVLVGVSVIYPAKVASGLEPREAIQFEK